MNAKTAERLTQIKFQLDTWRTGNKKSCGKIPVYLKSQIIPFLDQYSISTLSHMLGIKPKTLEQWRSTDTQPTFVELPIKRHGALSDNPNPSTFESVGHVKVSLLNGLKVSFSSTKPLWALLEELASCSA